MTFPLALWLACVASELAALGLAVAVVGRDARLPFRRPVNFRALGYLLRRIAPSPLVRLLAFAVAVDVAVKILEPIGAGGPRPRVGWHRVAYHLADAIWALWPLAGAWACRVTFADGAGGGVLRAENAGNLQGRARNLRGFWWSPSSASELKKARQDPQNPEGAILVQRPSLPALLAGAWIGCTVSLVAAHPVPRALTQGTLHAFELLCVAVTVAAIWRGRRATWRVEHRALVVLASAELVIATVGPFGHDAFASWPVIGAGIYLAAFSAVAGVLGWEIKRVIGLR